jgi:hypothetical protein
MSRVHHTARTPAFSPRLYSITPGEADYPCIPGVWPSAAPADGLFPPPEACAGIPIAAIGDRMLLSRFTIGLVCSVRCPGWIVLATYEFARTTPPGGAAIAGGFHSPMERTCLDTLLARHVPVIYCPARRLNARGIPRAWEIPLAEQRLLILSPFTPAQRRVTRDLARERNRFVAAVSGMVFVPSASRGGGTESLVRTCLRYGREVCTWVGEDNAHVTALGARGLAAGELLLRAAGTCESPPQKSGEGSL